MRIKLTDRFITNMQPSEEAWDSLVPGLLVRRGAKRTTFAFYARAGGKQHKPTLGHYPQISLAAARELAREAALRIANGAGPRKAAPHPTSPDAIDVGRLLDFYEGARLREGRRVKTVPTRLKQLRKELGPVLALPVRAVTKADAKAMRDAMIERGSVISANRMLAAAQTAWDWGVEEDYAQSNPFRIVRKTPELSRDRVLSQPELRAVYVAARQMAGGSGTAATFGRLVQFLCLTGCRRGEAASMALADVIGDTWHQSRNKTERPHDVHLTKTARALLGQGEPNALPFGRPTDGWPMRGFSKLTAKLRDLADLKEPWHLHDLRRTVASSMQRIGIRPDAIEGCLNHIMPGVGSNAAVYLRDDQSALKVDAWKRWEAELLRIVGEEPVVPLRRAR